MPADVSATLASMDVFAAADLLAVLSGVSVAGVQVTGVELIRNVLLALRERAREIDVNEFLSNPSAVTGALILYRHQAPPRTVLHELDEDASFAYRVQDLEDPVPVSIAQTLH